MSWLAPFVDEENCYFSTVGRRSGRVHEVEIWFGVVADTLYLISGNGPTADWFRNALANPEVAVRIQDQRRRGMACELLDGPQRRMVGELMGAKYPWDGDPPIGLTFDAWCFDVPVLAITNWVEIND